MINKKRNMNKDLLVVEDEIELTNLVVELISSDIKLTIDTASNGKEALEKLKENTYTLVISDVRMPEMSGIELLKEAKNTLESLPKFFLMSGFTDCSKNVALSAGANKVYNKPGDLIEMIDAAKALLSEKKAAV